MGRMGNGSNGENGEKCASGSYEVGRDVRPVRTRWGEMCVRFVQGGEGGGEGACERMPSSSSFSSLIHVSRFATAACNGQSPTVRDCRGSCPFGR
jgi:hypothetical protein